MRRLFLVTALLALLGAGFHMMAATADAQTAPVTVVETPVTTTPASGMPPASGVTLTTATPTAAAGGMTAMGPVTTREPSLALAWKSLPQSQKTLAVGSVLVLVAVTAALLYLAMSTDMLRDNTPSTFAGVAGATGRPLRRAFSLAQSQMAWWFVIVLAGYLYLFLVTGELDTLTGQALCLMGLGTGTAMGAAMVEQNKTNPILVAYQGVLTQIADPATPPADLPTLTATRDTLARQLASRDFVHDILTDANGISLHRFQTAVWTVVIGVLFLIETVVHRKMPDLDPYSLGVLGISAGTYLGFKIPEQPN
ncbi:hypothetical protein UAJ10_23890 [Nitrospirillum sp. BR 11164]|uniref:hypothetical protein n=1 Tax=Nitrospirillum sp. BR 11164 TaxID=3104324 RepID=UPI002B002231|nr:hypothetical protein [Nitrospirillum sp. BR 11164]MEA1652043.1 hypothetical protein [Nitrospirillum sp. BR 11164]